MKVFLVRVHKIANNFSFFDSCNCCYGNETVRIWTQSSLVTFESLWNVERIFFFDGKNASWCWYYQSSAFPNISEHVIDFVIEIGQDWMGLDWITWTWYMDSTESTEEVAAAMMKNIFCSLVSTKGQYAKFRYYFRSLFLPKNALKKKL